jgi:hypothetical protein
MPPFRLRQRPVSSLTPVYLIALSKSTIGNFQVSASGDAGSVTSKPELQIFLQKILRRHVVLTITGKI